MIKILLGKYRKISWWQPTWTNPTFEEFPNMSSGLPIALRSFLLQRLIAYVRLRIGSQALFSNRSQNFPPRSCLNQNFIFSCFRMLRELCSIDHYLSQKLHRVCSSILYYFSIFCDTKAKLTNIVDVFQSKNAINRKKNILPSAMEDESKRCAKCNIDE